MTARNDNAGRRPAYLDAREEWDAGATETQGPQATAGEAASAGPGDTPAATGKGTIRGIARSVQLTESRLAFRVERYDTSGNRLPPVAVEVYPFQGGQVSDGEEVEAVGRWKHGALDAWLVTNLTTGVRVRGGVSPVARKGCAIAAGVAVLVVALAGLGIWWFAQRDDGPSPDPLDRVRGAVEQRLPVPVPDVSGQSVSEAQRELDEAGLRGRPSVEASELPLGTVIRTDPPAGTPVARGSRITLFVSNGAP